MKLRPYQEKALDEIRAHYGNGVKKVLLKLATGGGKTLCFCTILKSVHAKGLKGIMVVRGKALVDQASDRLSRENVPHGVHMANHWRRMPDEPIQVCSVDTLFRRKIVPKAHLVVVDECFPPDVEILTNKGFKRFDALDKSELIAQVNQNNMKMDFAKPTRWIANEVEDINMLNLSSNKKIDISMTENHEILYEDQGITKKQTAKNFIFGTKNIWSSVMATGEDTELTNYEKLMIMYQADGNNHCIGKMYFTFSKERKIKDFEILMKNGKFQYKEISGKEANRNRNKKRRFSVCHIGNKSKFIGDHIKLDNLSENKCKKIIDYMVKWDGSIISENVFYYSSVIKENTDFYAAIAVMAGYHTNQVVQIDGRKDSFNNVHRLFITKNKKKITLQGVTKEWSKYSGKVYCVTVPQGNIVVRRNGKAIVIGNCHMANSPSFRWLIEQYPDAYILAVTATPYPKGGMRHLADEIVSPITMTELIEQGFLVPARYFIPSAIDLSGVAIDRKTQDYVAGQLSDRMNTAKLFGDMIASYKTMGENRPALCFAVSIEHSRRIVESFNAAGIPSAHIEADTPLEERQKIIRGLEENRIKIISNVGCLTTGVDIPAVSCIIMARPTKSYMLHIQCLGRATRIHPGKEDFIVLDHAANIQEHGFIEHEREVDLDGKEVKKKDIQLSMCSICYRAFVGTICPSCGKNKKGNVNEERNTDTDTSVQLVEIRSAEDLEKTRIQTFTDSCIKKAERNGYKPGWIYHQIKKRFGEKHAKGQWSKLKAIVPRSTRQAGDTDNPFDE